MMGDFPATVASKPVQLAMAEMNVALNALQLVIRHRGGAVLGLDEPLVIGCVDDVDVIVAGFPMEVRTRMTRMPRLHRPALTVDEAAGALEELVKKCVEMAPVDPCNDLGLSVVGVEHQHQRAAGAVVVDADARMGALDGDCAHGRGPFAGEHSNAATAGKAAE